MRRLSSILVSLLLAIPAASSAQEFEEEDDFVFDGEESTAPTPPPERIEGPDDLTTEEEEEVAPDAPVGPDTDLLGGEDDGPVNTAGDSAEIYRQRQAQYGKLPPDEEIGAWEGYLAEFQGTAFAERIQERIESLMDDLYSDRVDRGDGDVDALDQEIGMTQPILLENIDPRTRLRAGFEIGLPSWFNPFVDYEHAILRNLSAHVGIRSRYTGMSVEPGVKFALIKSTRTKTIVTGMFDAHLNAGGVFFFGARPAVGVAKRFGDKLDVQLQAAAEVEVRSPVGLRYSGGLSAFYRASQTVGMFLETNVSLKDVGGDSGVGYFNVATFGMKFFPSKKDGDISDDVQVDMAASAPYMQNYYAFHFGSILGQANLFLD